MCKIILSIKPEYVEKILSGEKKFEFRTKLAKRKVEKIIIYSTSPVMKVLGEVDVIATLTDSPELLWKTTSKTAGIDEVYFDAYFSNRKFANAYKLGEVLIYDSPRELNDFGLKTAPQSFIYI